MISDTVTTIYRQILADFAVKNRIPTIMASRSFPELGGLMSYGPTIADLFRRAATQVDKVLRGAKPGDLPVERPTKFDLVINVKNPQGPWAYNPAAPPTAGRPDYRITHARSTRQAGRDVVGLEPVSFDNHLVLSSKSLELIDMSPSGKKRE